MPPSVSRKLEDKYSDVHGRGQFRRMMQAMERRQHRRYVRRILVSFWVEGNPKEYKGYTTNVSLTGMFIASTHLPVKGSKVRVDIPDRGRLEAVVVRVKQVPIELRRVQPAGFGLRFSSHAEVVR